MKTFVVRFLGGVKEIEADEYVVIDSKLEFRNITGDTFAMVGTIPLSAILNVHEKKV